MLFEIFVYPGVIFIIFISLLYSGLIRKLAARMQNRIGPPIWQPFLDVIKLFGKEDINPEQVKMGFNLWPFIAFVSVIVSALLIPIGGIVPLNGDVITFIYFFILTSIALYLSGFSSSNPFGIVGAMRGLIMMISYEFPLIVSLITPLIFLNTMIPSVVNAYQLSSTPMMLLFPIASIVFFISLVAESEIPPFHIPNAHQEIVSGYATEYTGAKLAILEVSQMIKTFVLISLGICIFFGGAGDIITFIIKSLVLLFVVTLSRVLFARFRINNALKYGWILGFIGFIDLIRAALF